MLGDSLLQSPGDMALSWGEWRADLQNKGHPFIVEKISSPEELPSLKKEERNV